MGSVFLRDGFTADKRIRPPVASIGGKLIPNNNVALHTLHPICGTLIVMQTTSPITINRLTKELAFAFVDDLVSLASLIPNVTYLPGDILADSNKARRYPGKWDHSLVCFHTDRPIGLLIAYERAADPDSGYHVDSIYLNVMAVNAGFQGQGIGSALLDALISQESGTRFRFLPGTPSTISTQTNLAPFNKPVLHWYKKRGFVPIGTKAYDNRVDCILYRQL